MAGPCPEGHFEAKDGVAKCPLCEKEFGTFRWKYNCHMCGQVVCDDCSKTTMTLPPVWVREPVKVCDKCRGVAAQTGGRTAGGGRALGGSGPTTQGTEEEERAKRLAMIEARQKQPALRPLSSQGGARPRGATGPPAHNAHAPPAEPAGLGARAATEPPGVAPPPPAGDGGGMGTRAEPDPAARGGAPNPMLEAAMRRQAAAAAGAPAGQRKTDDPEKLQLLAQINAILHRRGESEPFGLRAMDNAKLRVYLKNLKP